MSHFTVEAGFTTSLAFSILFQVIESPEHSLQCFIKFTTCTHLLEFKRLNVLLLDTVAVLFISHGAYQDLNFLTASLQPRTGALDSNTVHFQKCLSPLRHLNSLPDRKD